MMGVVSYSLGPMMVIPFPCGKGPCQQPTKPRESEKTNIGWVDRIRWGAIVIWGSRQPSVTASWEEVKCTVIVMLALFGGNEIGDAICSRSVRVGKMVKSNGTCLGSGSVGGARQGLYGRVCI